MSENITHTAVTDDCVRLALHSPTICEAFKSALSDNLEIARLAGVTRSGGKWVTPLLTQYRQVWPDRHSEDRLEQKMAFVLGWLCHRAADLQFKPVFHATDGACPLDPTDCSIYHDVFLFREVYGSGQRDPYVRGILDPAMTSSPAAACLDMAEMESALRSVWQRALLGMHTFIPDQSDIDDWLEKLIKTRQEFYVDISRYAQAFTDPDPDKVRRFIVEVNFYDPQDDLIRLARALQRGGLGTYAEVQPVVMQARSQSLYAQALARGYGYLQAASDYFLERIDGEAFKDRLGCGAQGI